MAYIAFADPATHGATHGVAWHPSPLVAAVPAPVSAPVHDPVVDRVDGTRPRLSALEWSVVALARRDGLSSLRTPGRIAMAMGALFGDRRAPRLADPRLEALRRIAVLSHHYGYGVPTREITAFTDAGFTPAHYDLVVDSVEAARLRENRGRARA